jgi:hypothetical protein
LRALSASPPQGWSDERQMGRLGDPVVDACRKADPWLAGRFDAAAALLVSA